MAEKIKIHPITPHQKRIFTVSDKIKSGEIAIFPTDSQYALGCLYSNKKGVERIKKIRRLSDNHLFTLLCESISNISEFAKITDENFKIIKRLIPGPFTIILPSTKEVPKLLLNKTRKTVGFRVPDYPIIQRLIAEIGEPLIATTAKHPDYNGRDKLYFDRNELFDSMEKFVDVIVDDEQDTLKQESTVIDMTGEHAVVLRRGMGFEKVEEVFALYDKPLITSEEVVA